MARVIYVIIRGGTKLTERIAKRWLPNLDFEATPTEAREMARPLARYVARRVDFVGDSNDTVDALAFFFALASFASRVAGIDPANVETSDGFDAELLREVEKEVNSAYDDERARRGIDRPPVAASGADALERSESKP